MSTTFSPLRLYPDATFYRHVVVLKEALSAELAVLHVALLQGPSVAVELNKFEVASVAVVACAVRAVDADTSAGPQRPVAVAQRSVAMPDDPAEKPDVLAVFLDVLPCPGVLAAESVLPNLAAGFDVLAPSAWALYALGAFPVACSLGAPSEGLTAAYDVLAVQPPSVRNLADALDLPDELGASEEWTVAQQRLFPSQSFVHRRSHGHLQMMCCSAACSP